MPKEWSDKYQGKFDDGWDVLREKIITAAEEARRRARGCRTHRRHDEIPAWDDMPDELKPVLARQMEIYAGFLEQTDHEIGRVVDAIDDLGFLDDTLIYFIIGDNGASAEGTLNGCFNEMTTLNGMPGIETTEFLLSKIDDFGTPDGLQPLRRRLGARAVRAVSVDQAGGLALGRHPQRHDRALAQRDRRQGRRPQTSSTTSSTSHRPSWRRPDCPRRRSVNGIAQAPLEGVSMLGTLRDATAPETHDVQYFEMLGNRGIYHQGWTAVTKHRTPWKADTPPPFDDDVWELYGPDDWTQAHDWRPRIPRNSLSCNGFG